MDAPRCRTPRRSARRAGRGRAGAPAPRRPSLSWTAQVQPGPRCAGQCHLPLTGGPNGRRRAAGAEHPVADGG